MKHRLVQLALLAHPRTLPIYVMTEAWLYSGETVDFSARHVFLSSWLKSMNNHTDMGKKYHRCARYMSKLTRLDAIWEGALSWSQDAPRKGAELTKFTNVDVYYVH